MTILRLIILFIMVLSCSAFAAEQKEAPVVMLDSGPISGRITEGVREYLGIPYAAAPIGKLRWKIPKDVPAWTNVRKCTEFGPSCPQPPTMRNLEKISEDCLYLNVWTAAGSSADKLPVMVWIHGGAWNFGSSSFEEYNGVNLANKGVVVVNFNYRLGPFGFWTHPRLSMESSRDVSGNYGFLDAIMALWWVQFNIDAFGGDPDNVTIFGESAGAVNVTLLMVSPLAKGLFHRAIAESGGPVGIQYLIPQVTGDMAASLKMGKALAVKLKCDKADDVVASMRRKTTEDILEAYDFKMGLFGKGLFFGPVFDGWALPKDPAKVYSSGDQYNVPIIIGSNKDEGTDFITAEDRSMKKYKLFMESRFGRGSSKAMGLFPAKRKKESIARALNDAITVAAFAEPARFVADSMKKKKAKAYLYQFTR
ncbi:MAG: carboxylesterase family protein, partial [Candidatus Omnitrophica bacterium]|nr:carboxylesterase family protein [Candidatus Omnitrophota bacterium]